MRQDQTMQDSPEIETPPGRQLCIRACHEVLFSTCMLNKLHVLTKHTKCSKADLSCCYSGGFGIKQREFVVIAISSSMPEAQTHKAVGQSLL